MVQLKMAETRLINYVNSTDSSGVFWMLKALKETVDITKIWPTLSLVPAKKDYNIKLELEENP